MILLQGDKCRTGYVDTAVYNNKLNVCAKEGKQKKSTIKKPQPRAAEPTNPDQGISYK